MMQSNFTKKFEGKYNFKYVLLYRVNKDIILFVCIYFHSVWNHKFWVYGNMLPTLKIVLLELNYISNKYIGHGVFNQCFIMKGIYQCNLQAS